MSGKSWRFTAFGGHKGTDMTKGIAWAKQAKKIADQMNKDGVCYVTVIPRREWIFTDCPTTA
jgi:hypothetical protein